MRAIAMFVPLLVVFVCGSATSRPYAAICAVMVCTPDRLNPRTSRTFRALFIFRTFRAPVKVVRGATGRAITEFSTVPRTFSAYIQEKCAHGYFLNNSAHPAHFPRTFIPFLLS
ncbi:hypothetical protein R4O66_001442 [Salmonella enterica]|nr:hypothetical protein [Salmonella enterica]ELR6875678.1 hypothetical protein [Salmonella enterica]